MDGWISFCGLYWERSSCVQHNVYAEERVGNLQTGRLVHISLREPHQLSGRLSDSQFPPLQNRENNGLLWRITMWLK